MMQSLDLPTSQRAGYPMKPLRISLRVVFYKEGKVWIAHCLEFDLLGHGRTRKDALRMMSKAIALQVAVSVKHNNPRNLFSPADGKVFAMFAAGKDVAAGKLEIEVLQNEVTMAEQIEAREYTGNGVEVAFA
jgi:predicted RNase H-like HicB family nuclease